MQSYHLPAPGIIRRCKASSSKVCAVPEERHAEFVTWEEAEVWASEVKFSIPTNRDELPERLKPRVEAEEQALQAIAKIGENPTHALAARDAIQKGKFDVLFTREGYNRLALKKHSRREGVLHWRLQSRILLFPRRPYSFAAVFLAFSMLRGISPETSSGRAVLRTHRAIALQMEKDAASEKLKEALRRESDRLAQLLNGVDHATKSELTFRPGTSPAPRNLTPEESNYTARQYSHG